MTILESLVLAIVQGIAEFLPISSSAHLVLVPWWLGWDAPPLIYDVTVHMGTTLAVIGYYWQDWLKLIGAGLRAIRKRRITEPDERLFYLLILATLPAGVAGLLIKDYFKSVFSDPPLVAAMLLVTAALLVVSERLAQVGKDLDNITTANALFIGLAQALAVIPGISRSGSTIAAGLRQGLSRPDAARFSFLLSTPIILGAGAVQLLDVVSGDVVVEGDLTAVLVVGFVASAVTGYASIDFLLNFLRQRSLYVFAIYCAGFGIISLIASLVQG